jgi:hypothetical protein
MCASVHAARRQCTHCTHKWWSCSCVKLALFVLYNSTIDTSVTAVQLNGTHSKCGATNHNTLDVTTLRSELYADLHNRAASIAQQLQKQLSSSGTLSEAVLAESLLEPGICCNVLSFELSVLALVQCGRGHTPWRRLWLILVCSETYGAKSVSLSTCFLYRVSKTQQQQ